MDTEVHGTIFLYESDESHEWFFCTEHTELLREHGCSFNEHGGTRKVHGLGEAPLLDKEGLGW